MDPISIVAAATQLVAICADLTLKLGKFVDEASQIDDTIQAFSAEIDALSRVLISVSTSFNDSDFENEQQHWDNVRASLKDCNKTLTALRKIIVNVIDSRGGALSRAVAQIKMTI